MQAELQSENLKERDHLRDLTEDNIKMDLK
jgi:hypothetical protein